MEARVTVVLIEDHPVVTEGVTSWIRSDPAAHDIGRSARRSA